MRTNINQFSLLLDISFHNEGIAPITSDLTPVGEMISLLDEEAQIISKRKFRKLWKKAFKAACEDVKMRNTKKSNLDIEIQCLKDRVGFGSSDPEPQQKRQRKRLVREFLFRNLPLSSVG